MNSRSFLKALSAIPLIGLPVKLLAKKEFVDPSYEIRVDRENFVGTLEQMGRNAGQTMVDIQRKVTASKV